MKQETKRGLFATTVLAGLAITMPALAQAPVQTTPAPAPAATEDEDVVVVTGSRLVRQDFTAISPVTTVGAQDIELTATLSVEQLLNELPSVIPGNTVTSNNSGGESFATVDLRGLGVNRTLVLVNGERVPASSTTGAVDLNTIPAGLLDKIEVVTGGASAVYGSDAVAGVVNFILKDDYEGLQVTSSVKSAENGDAQEFSADFLFGGNFANGKGNLTLYGNYYDREGVFQSAYDYSKTSAAIFYDYNTSHYVVVDTLAEANALLGDNSVVAASGGSGTPPFGQISGGAGGAFVGLGGINANFTNVDHDCNPATPGITVNAPSNVSFSPTGALVPSRTAGACAVPGRDNAAGTSSRFNFAPDNYLVIPAERFGFTSIGSYQVTDKIKADVMATYANSEVVNQLAPTPVTGLSIPVTSPLIPADLAAALATRANPTANFTMAWRSSQLGGRVGTFQNQTFNLRTGLTGELPGGWEWHATAGFGQVNFSGELKNNVNKTALNQGLTGCANIPTIARLPGCVNVNIFGAAALTPAMRSFITTDTKQQARLEQTTLGAYVRGDMFELPAGPVSAVFGAEYREDTGSFKVDDAQRTGDIYGFNATQSVAGALDVYEAYTEIGIPILADLPFIKSLNLELGARVSDYSTIGTVSTYKVGGEYEPVSWLKFRAVYNEAVRAPGLLELFQNGDQGFPAFTDPCRQAQQNTNPGRTAFCTTGAGAGATVPVGVISGFAANNSQVQAFAFGNPNLKEESAESFTFGAVFQPDWLPIGDLDLSIDYYDIIIRDSVVTVGAQTIINRCYINQQLPSCALITRNSVSGQIDAVNTSITNAQKQHNAGIDVQADFGFDLDEVFKGAPGRLTIKELYSYLDVYSFDGDNNDIRGTNNAGIGGATFPWKSVFTTDYEVGDFLFQARWSYTPEMEGQNFGEISPAAQYVDLSGRWDVTDAFRMTLVVSNVADELPPQTAEGFFGQSNTDVQTYRTLGRTFALSGRLKF